MDLSIDQLQTNPTHEAKNQVCGVFLGATLSLLAGRNFQFGNLATCIAFLPFLAPIVWHRQIYCIRVHWTSQGLWFEFAQVGFNIRKYFRDFHCWRSRFIVKSFG